MRTEILTGLFTLGGVVVGGVLNVGVGVALDSRQRRRDAHTAIRLLVPELETNERAIQYALDTGNWRRLGEISTERWVAHESRLAESLPADSWGTLFTVYAGIDLVVDDARHTQDDTMDPDDQAHLRLILDVLQEALARLRKAVKLGDRASYAREAEPIWERYLEAGGGQVTLPQRRWPLAWRRTRRWRR